jgi:hypothetical protein
MTGPPQSAVPARRSGFRGADATDQPVAVRGRPVNGRLQVLDLEGHVAQSQLIGGGGRRTGRWPSRAKFESSSRVRNGHDVLVPAR